MKILYIDQFSEIGGAQKCMLDLWPAFRERSWELYTALPGDGPLVKWMRAHGIAVETIPCGPYRSGWARAIDFARFASDRHQQAMVVSRLTAKHTFDLIYVNGPRVLEGAVKGAGSTPILFHAHNHLPSYALHLLGQSLAAANVQTVACCESVARTFLPHISHDRIQVILNGTPALPFRTRGSAAGRPWKVGLVGRIQPEKGQMKLLRAAITLFPSLPDLHIVFAGVSWNNGYGYNDRLRSLARGFPVEFLGWRDDIAEVLGNLDLLVIASELEGLPRVMLESFSAGLPVLAFPTGGISECLQDGVTGFLVRDQSPKTLASRILQVATEDQRLITAVTRNARRRWDLWHNVADYRKHMITAVQRVASGTSLGCGVPQDDRGASMPV